jgi:two-component system phosphate regulon response regulator PhoB
MQIILVVDDNELAHEVIRLSTYRSKQYKILSAYNSEQAIKLLKKYDDISLIILDVLLGNTLGYDLYLQIINNQATAHIPIIFHTGLVAQTQELQMILNNTNLYILYKPYSADILLEVVRCLALDR